MSSSAAAENSMSGEEADAGQRQRLPMVSAVVLIAAAAVVSYFGINDTWRIGERRAVARTETSAILGPDPAWDIELPEGPHRDEFQSSCLICHSARLPLGQPRFKKEKWGEIVHKMAAVYGAPLTALDEANVVEYLLVARPPAP